MIDQFHFLRPYWLLAVLPFLWLGWLLLRDAGSGNRWKGIVDPVLLEHLLDRQGVRSARWPVVVIVLAWLMVVVALAGPTWERQLSPVYRGADERVLVVDVSKSMDATDLKPSRMVRARQKLTDILQRSADTQTALVVFAAVPYVVSPLTDDAQTISSMVGSLETSIVPAQGSRLDLALESAMELLQGAGSRQGSIWLLTDSPATQSAVTQARRIASAGFTLSVMGFGTREGAPIQESEGGFVKDRSGNIVVAKLDPAALQDLATAGSGVYTDALTTDRDLDRLFASHQSGLDVRQNEQRQQTEVWLDRGPWLILLVLPFAALFFRRGWL